MRLFSRGTLLERSKSVALMNCRRLSSIVLLSIIGVLRTVLAEEPPIVGPAQLFLTLKWILPVLALKLQLSRRVKEVLDQVSRFRILPCLLVLRSRLSLLLCRPCCSHTLFK